MSSQLNSYRSRDWERERASIERQEEPANVTNERLPRSDSFNSLYAQGGPQAGGDNRASEDEEDDDDEDQIIQAPILRSVSKSKEVSIDKDTNFYTYISSGVGGGRSSSMDPLRSMGSNQPDGFRVNIPSMYSKDSEKVKAESATANVNLDEKLPDVEEAQRRREMRRLSRQQSLDRTSSGVSGISRRASGVSGVRVSTITLDDSDDDEKVETPTRFRRASSLQSTQGIRDQGGRQGQAYKQDNRAAKALLQEAAVKELTDQVGGTSSQQSSVTAGTVNIKSEDVFKLTEDDLDDLENNQFDDTPVTLEQQANKALNSQPNIQTGGKNKKVQLPEETDVIPDKRTSMNLTGILDSSKSEFERMMKDDAADRVIQKMVETSAFSVNDSVPATPSPYPPKKQTPKLDEKEFTEEEVETKEEKVAFEKRLPSSQLPQNKTKVEEETIQEVEETEVIKVADTPAPPTSNQASNFKLNNQVFKINEVAEKVVDLPVKSKKNVEEEKNVASSPQIKAQNVEVEKQGQFVNKLQERVSIEVDSSPIPKTTVVPAAASSKLPVSSSNSTVGLKVVAENSEQEAPSLQEIVEKKRINSESKVLEGGVQQEKIHSMGSISRMIDEGSGFGGRTKAPMAKVPEDTIPKQSSPKYSKQFSVGEQSLMDQLTNHKPWGESRSGSRTFNRSISMLDRNDSIEAQGGPYNPPSTNDYQFTVNSSKPYSSVQLRAAAAGEYSPSSTNQNNPYAGISLRSAAKSYLSQPANSYMSQPANSSSQNATTNSPLDRSTSNISDYSETASSSGSSKVRGITDRFGGSVVGSRTERRSRAGSLVSGAAATPKLDLAKIRTELRSRGDVGTVSMPVSPTSVSKISEIGPYPSAHSSTGPPLRRAESLCIDSNGRKWRYLVRAETMGLMRPVQFTPRAAKPLWMRSERERRRRIAAEARRKWNMSDYAQQLQSVPKQQGNNSSSNNNNNAENDGQAQISNPKFERTLSKFKVLEETDDHFHSDLFLETRSLSLVGEKTSQFEMPSTAKQSEARERVRRAHSTKSYLKDLREEALKAINDE